jgi:tyrosyl-tRNA synthetase
MILDEQLAYLTKGCVDVVRSGELRAKLERAGRLGQQLTVKVGFDPTAPDLHLGHAVLLRKMKHFQDLGHRVIFLIGDFTALIGDPTGRSKTRPALTREEIEKNAETYRSQVFRLLDPDRTVVDFNSRWLGAMDSVAWIRLSSRYNVAQMLERREFKQRYEQGRPIALHEFLYPLSQGYDSVVLKADVELGGTDQLFNLNVGRDIMPAYDLEPQVVMTTPLLEGLDGVEKMSKSLNNYVAMTESAPEMFGKLMSISDELMWRYYLLLTDLSRDAIEALQQQVTSGRLHPKQAKVNLAKLVVGDFHSAPAADRAADAFEARFVRGEVAIEELPTVEVTVAEGTIALARLVVEAGLASSTSEATRKVQQGGVKVDREKATDARERIPATRGTLLLEVGRRMVRVNLRF